MSFSSIKFLFPSLFSSVSSLGIDCEICQLLKHVRNSYPLSNNKSYIHFAIVHSDVWGLAPFCLDFDILLNLLKTACMHLGVSHEDVSHEDKG